MIFVLIFLCLKAIDSLSELESFVGTLSFVANKFCHAIIALFTGCIVLFFEVKFSNVRPYNV